jgi:hypothetical protein
MIPVRKQGYALGLLLCSFTPPALPAIPDSLFAPANCAAFTEVPLAYVLCDDGIPDVGGVVPNLTGEKAVTVPAKYGDSSNRHIGLPEKSSDAMLVPGADLDGNIALDVNVSLPTTPPPAGGYPLLFMMHGCCSGNKTGWQADSFDAPGERWHYSNAWFASRGYVVVNYTSRGFHPDQFRGSTGQNQLDSRSYEVNDLQHLACQIHAHAAGWSGVNGVGGGQTVAINPNRVVVTGGSYGGGLTWMTLTDPKWTCTPDTGIGGSGGAATAMSLVAVAPKYGWTDLVYSLVPTGMHGQRSSDPLPKTDGCDTGPRRPDGSECDTPGPAGMPKSSIIAGLYATGTAGGSTFPPEITVAEACLQSVYPLEDNPACLTTLSTTLPEFLRERSAYYQQEFFDRIATDPSYRIPVFSAATFTDPLFTPVEHRRMQNRLRSIVPNYPIQAYYGDYQHFVQNKSKEWGDLCVDGETRRVCNIDDYNGNFNGSPANLVRVGVTTRLNRFIDHYAKPAGNPNQPAPAFDVTVALQITPDTAAQQGRVADEPGETYSAATFEALTQATREWVFEETRTTLSTVPGNEHAITADPVYMDVVNGKLPPVEDEPAGEGVAVYESEPLSGDLVMIGASTLSLEFEATGDTASVQLNTRLYDVFPDGRAVLVDRGPRRLSAAEAAAGVVSYQLHGNGWRFGAGHAVRLEITQDDFPFLKNSTPPSTVDITRAQLSMPIRTLAGGGAGGTGSGSRWLGLPALTLLLPLLLLAGLRRRRR